jgi:hypothetical protein
MWRCKRAIDADEEIANGLTIRIDITSDLGNRGLSYAVGKR